MRLWLGVALAFVVGVGVSALLLSDVGASLTRAGPDELVVRVTNAGSHEANFTLELGRLGVRTFFLGANETYEERFEGPPREQLVVRLHVAWVSPEGPRGGTAAVIADGRDCPDKRLMVTFGVDTTVGVAVRPASDCL